MAIRRRSGWASGTGIDQQGYTLDIIKQWRQVGARSISDIRRLVEAGFTLRSAGSWHALGYRPLDWLAFIKHGYNFDDARKWRALGFDNFNDIRQLTRQGFELDTAEKWASSGIPYKEWATWKQHGFRVNEVVVWRRAGFRSADMVAQLKKVVLLLLSPNSGLLWDRPFGTGKSSMTWGFLWVMSGPGWMPASKVPTLSRIICLCR